METDVESEEDGEMNQSDFLRADLPNVLKHYRCCLTCLSCADDALMKGNLELAEKRMIDFNRSLSELHRLKEKKRLYDEAGKLFSIVR